MRGKEQRRQAGGGRRRVRIPEDVVAVGVGAPIRWILRAVCSGHVRCRVASRRVPFLKFSLPPPPRFDVCLHYTAKQQLGAGSRACGCGNHHHIRCRCRCRWPGLVPWLVPSPYVLALASHFWFGLVWCQMIRESYDTERARNKLASGSACDGRMEWMH